MQGSYNLDTLLVTNPNKKCNTTLQYAFIIHKSIQDTPPHLHRTLKYVCCTRIFTTLIQISYVTYFHVYNYSTFGKKINSKLISWLIFSIKYLSINFTANIEAVFNFCTQDAEWFSLLASHFHVV